MFAKSTAVATATIVTKCRENSSSKNPIGLRDLDLVAEAFEQSAGRFDSGDTLGVGLHTGVGRSEADPQPARVGTHLVGEWARRRRGCIRVADPTAGDHVEHRSGVTHRP